MCPEFWVHIKLRRPSLLGQLFFHHENLRALSAPAEAVCSLAYEAACAKILFVPLVLPTQSFYNIIT